MDPCSRLTDALRDLGAGHLAIITGAGISVASGIPTFRGDDPEAVWKNEVTEKGTRRFFHEDPVASWTWSRKLFEKIPHARPNPAHRAVATLEAWQRSQGGEATLITQNVDTLHEQAGSPGPIKVHGTIDRVRCTAEGACPNAAPAGSLPLQDSTFDRFTAEPGFDTLPRCPACGGLIRPHVLWFDEYYADHADYQWGRVQETAESADLLLFIGTSFAVGVTEMFLHAGLTRHLPVFSVDPAATAPYPGVEALTARAEELLPAVCRRLGQPLET